MATLYHRATPAQRVVLRMVEGAVLNVAHHHPHYGLDKKVARSIAKRAAGTLTAQWPDVLAAVPNPLSEQSALLCNGPRARPETRRCNRGTGRGASQSLSRRSPLRELRKSLGMMAGWARKAGHEQRAAAFADALRVLARIEKGV